MSRYNYTVYTDASHNAQHKLAASAYVIINNLTGEIQQGKNGYQYVETSNEAERLGVFAALEKLPKRPGSIIVYCDNQGLMSSLESFTSGGFGVSKKSKKLDFSEEEIQILKKTKSRNIQFSWVRGHNGTTLNEVCDKQSRQELRNMIADKLQKEDGLECLQVY